MKEHTSILSLMAKLPKELQIVIMREAAKGMSIDQRLAMNIGPGKLHVPIPLRDMLEYNCGAKQFIIRHDIRGQENIRHMLLLRSATLAFEEAIESR